ncbi:MAG: CRISPR-associated endonuclease Cas1 [Planctomycetes bacterium]|nr:CRISPR-associated endonuclease Cas1 [Planctomycetota bacterium]
MKQDVHITSHSALIRMQGEEFLVADGESTRRLEACRVGNFFLHTNAEMTTPALKFAAAREIGVHFLDGSGRLLAALVPPARCGVELRARQHQLAPDAAFGHEVARQIVTAKLHACTRLLRNYRRLLGREAPGWRELQAMTRSLPAGEGLFGAEGSAARRYWELYARLLRSAHGFASRQARPPADPVNSMLSFGYHVLTGMLAATLHAEGFENALGYLHAADEKRPTLAIDMIEPLRALAVDRLVLRLWNNRVLQTADFEQTGEGCYLTRPGRRIFLREFHAWLSRPLRASLRPVGAEKSFCLLDAAQHNRVQLRRMIETATPGAFWPKAGDA